MTLCVGCGGPPHPPPSTVPNPERVATPSQLFLSPFALDEAFLIGVDAPIRWRFVGQGFVVESWRQPLPEPLQQSMLNQTGVVYRISGEWTLADDGQRLRLNQLRADGPVPKPNCELQLEQGPRDTLLVLGTSYRLQEHPFGPEVLPVESLRARLEEVLAGDLVRIRHHDQSEILRLDSIVCPPPTHPLGEQALERARELMEGRMLRVKIYAGEAEGPRRGQIFSGNFYWVNLQLVEDGLAWHDKPNDDQWLFATREDGARLQRLGIWSESGLEPPWWEVNQD